MNFEMWKQIFFR